MRSIEFLYKYHWSTEILHVGNHETWLLAHDLLKKLTSKWTSDLALKPERIKFLKENMEGRLDVSVD